MAGNCHKKDYGFNIAVLVSEAFGCRTKCSECNIHTSRAFVSCPYVVKIIFKSEQVSEYITALTSTEKSESTEIYLQIAAID